MEGFRTRRWDDAITKYVEESHARDLHSELSRAFGANGPETVVSINGAGVHWDCIVLRNPRLCSIHCFDVRGSPEYLISFDQEKQQRAMGRTSSQEDVVTSMGNWLEGQEVRA
jgi:hypothetical protein